MEKFSAHIGRTIAWKVFEQHTVYPNESIYLGELRPGIYYVYIDEEQGQILILR